MLSFKQFTIKEMSLRPTTIPSANPNVRLSDFRQGKESTLQKIPIGDLRTTQGEFDPKVVDKIRKGTWKGGDSGPVTVTHFKSKHYNEKVLTNGHHRVEAALKNGETHILANVTIAKETRF